MKKMFLHFLFIAHWIINLTFANALVEKYQSFEMCKKACIVFYNKLDF